MTELPLLPLGRLCSMELDVMLYRVCVSEVSTTALFLCKMGYALLSFDTGTFLINTACILSYYSPPPSEFKLLLKSGKIISYSSFVLKTSVDCWE